MSWPTALVAVVALLVLGVVLLTYIDYLKRKVG